MQCTKLNPCSCGGDIRIKTLEDKEFELDSSMPYICSVCTTEYYGGDIICSGKVVAQWKGDTAIDCLCASCGASYGAHALNRERVLENFQAV